MKEIKFRAWNKNQRVMATRHDCDPAFNWLSETNPTIFEVRADNFILMQFTGLKDKNGKEIWEGDIVNYLGHSPRIVEWTPEGHYTGWFAVGGQRPLPMAQGNEANETEILGNIYENPELLK